MLKSFDGVWQMSVNLAQGKKGAVVGNGDGAWREAAGCSMFWRLHRRVTLALPHMYMDYGVLIWEKKIPEEKKP